jgi:nitroimidazol reductase NimA-like FMN-containing flavoprotein (pyridoxamine 5'-phosphate oxidase superfamily)
MRKVSREMPEEWALKEVFAKAPYITVSMVTPKGEPYAVPLSLAMTDDKTFYFHCAKEGKKSDIWETNPVVWLSAVSKCKPTVGPKDGSFTLEFRSATAKGVVNLVTDRAEQIKGLKAISERFLPNHMDAFDAAVERSLSHTAVYRITLTEPAVGKRKQYDANGDEMKYGRME